MSHKTKQEKPLFCGWYPTTGMTATCKAKRFFLVYRLGEDGDLLKEGDGRLSVWALRARSYKTRAEACHQGIAHYPLQGVYLVFVLHLERSSSGSNVQEFKGSYPSNP